MAGPNRKFNIVSLLPVASVVAAILQLPSIVVFILNLLALSVLLGWIVRSVYAVCVNVGRLPKELLKATLGNAVELTIGISAVVQGRACLARSVILGSVLCNLLLVLGSSLFIAGYGRNRLRFDRTLTTTLSSLLMVVIIILIIPTAMEALSAKRVVSAAGTLMTQQVTAIVLVALLFVFLFFRLYSHADMFASTPFHYGGSDGEVSQSAMNSPVLQPVAGRWSATLTLLASSISMSVCAYLLVERIDGAAATLRTNPSFLTITAVPLIGNLMKHRKIVAGSRPDKQVERGIRALINGVSRLTMLVSPLLVFVGWIFNQPLALKFDEFEATTLLLSIVVMTYLLADGRSNYFEGLMLIGTYVIMVFSFYIRPEPSK